MKPYRILHCDKTTTIDDVMDHADAVAEQGLRSSMTTMLLMGMDVDFIDEQMQSMRADWLAERARLRIEILEFAASAREERRRQ